jgi:hypothetical protein
VLDDSPGQMGDGSAAGVGAHKRKGSRSSIGVGFDDNIGHSSFVLLILLIMMMMRIM